MAWGTIRRIGFGVEGLMSRQSSFDFSQDEVRFLG
ncbi:hypothetical protein HY29_06155 [Hyphomonas beringensis]|uniref:Uncharacterized protein n=1 Tax=Hyphomonas beringensis TaxID=1280946 RepID=A0A062U450_9PROT|nr:hypothetical protein HY29_06155 [Hyphomonas beringensis]